MCHFPASLFEGYDGCENGDRGCGWCGGVGCSSGVDVVKVVCGVRMGLGVSDVGNRGEGKVSSGENVSVTDGGADGRGTVAGSPIGFL